MFRKINERRIKQFTGYSFQPAKLKLAIIYEFFFNVFERIYTCFFSIWKTEKCMKLEGTKKNKCYCFFTDSTLFRCSNSSASSCRSDNASYGWAVLHGYDAVGKCLKIKNTPSKTKAAVQLTNFFIFEEKLFHLTETKKIHHLSKHTQKENSINLQLKTKNIFVHFFKTFFP